MNLDHVSDKDLIQMQERMKSETYTEAIKIARGEMRFARISLCHLEALVERIAQLEEERMS